MVLPMSSLRLPVPILDNPTPGSSAQALGGLTFSLRRGGRGDDGYAPRRSGGWCWRRGSSRRYMQNVPNELVNDGGGRVRGFPRPGDRDGLQLG